MDLEKKIELLRYALSIRLIYREILSALIALDYDRADKLVSVCLTPENERPAWLMAYTNATTKPFGASEALALFGPEEV